MLPRVQPMRLTRIAKAFDDPDYLFELKHDGFRAIAYIEAGECKLVSRNLKHFKSFDHLKKSLDKLPVQNAIIDGEVVCLDANGISQFNELMSRKGKHVFYAFDLLWLNGDDLRCCRSSNASSGCTNWSGLAGATRSSTPNTSKIRASVCSRKYARGIWKASLRNANEEFTRTMD